MQPLFRNPPLKRKRKSGSSSNRPRRKTKKKKRTKTSATETEQGGSLERPQQKTIAATQEPVCSARPGLSRAARPTHALVDGPSEGSDGEDEFISGSDSDSDASDPAGGRGEERVPERPRRSCANMNVPAIGRVSAGDDLPNWTVERANCLDGTHFLLYRNARGEAVGSRMAALAASGQLELPTRAIEEIRDIIRRRRRHTRDMHTAFIVAPILRDVLTCSHNHDGTPRTRFDYPKYLTETLRPPPPFERGGDGGGGNLPDGVTSLVELGGKVVVVDLFCGLGGLSLGLRAAGFSHILGIDKNATAIGTFDANECGWGTMRQQLRKGDLSKWKEAFEDAGLAPDGQGVRKAEVILVGGPPCQPFSDNGTRRGDGDERDGLGFSIELTLLIRPLVLLLENVPSLFEGGKFDEYVQPLMQRLRDGGYEPRVTIHSCARHRVPQQRRRLLLTAIRTDAWGGVAWTPSLQVKAPHGAPVVLPFDALHSDNLWEGPCPPELQLTPQTIRSRQRIRDASSSTGVVVSGRPSPTVLTTCVSSNCYQRLILLPTDVNVDVVCNGDVRTLTLQHAKLLQSFPPTFQVYGHVRMQGLLIGNAVPPMFALDIGHALLRVLSSLPRVNTRVTSSEDPSSSLSSPTLRSKSPASEPGDCSPRASHEVTMGRPTSNSPTRSCSNAPVLEPLTFEVTRSCVEKLRSVALDRLTP
jgi:site-specific DNA-cytosine methylase